MLGDIPDRIIMSEVDNLAIKYAIRSGSHKTIYSPLEREAYIPNTVEVEVFDLEADPLEQTPLLSDLESEAMRVRGAFDEVSGMSLQSGGQLDADFLDAELRARLEALGYLEDARREENREASRDRGEDGDSTPKEEE
jgi:hypothetical protein